MNEALDIYEDESQVISIHGYIYPINGLPETFFIKGADCWGWATWKRGWDIFEADGQKLLNELKKRKLQKEANFNNSYGYVEMLESQILGKNNSWAIRWYASAFLKDMLTLYPGKSYVQNIGHDSQGTHCKHETNVFNVDLNNISSIKRIDVKEDLITKKRIEIFFKKINPNVLKRIFLKLIKVIKK